MDLERLHSCFMNILWAALNGERLCASPELSPEEWAQLMNLAQTHHVLPLVFEAVHDLPEVKNASWAEPTRRQVRRQVLVQTQKTCDFLNLYKRLLAAGIRPLVVKGII